MPVMTRPSALRHTALDLLDLVQTVSGCQAVVTANRQLPTMAALRMARGSVRVHSIEYNPDLVSEPDYYVVGQRGLDVNNPEHTYRLRSLPGEFTGLQLVSYLYVGRKQIAPDSDVGFDLAREYEAAQALHAGTPAPNQLKIE